MIETTTISTATPAMTPPIEIRLTRRLRRYRRARKRRYTNGSCSTGASTFYTRPVRPPHSGSSVCTNSRRGRSVGAESAALPTVSRRRNRRGPCHGAPSRAAGYCVGLSALLSGPRSRGGPRGWLLTMIAGRYSSAASSLRPSTMRLTSLVAHVPAQDRARRLSVDLDADDGRVLDLTRGCRGQARDTVRRAALNSMRRRL